MARVCKGLLLIAGLSVALVAAPPASAASLGQLYKDYSSNGALDPCKYSAHDLQGALNSIPTDVQQYDPRFAAALRNALAFRTSGGCGVRHDSSSDADGSGGGGVSGGGSDDGSGTAVAPDGSPKPPEAPATVKGELASSDAQPANFDANRGFPLALAILAAIVALILSGVGITVLGRRYGWDLPDIFSGSRPNLTS